MRDKKLVASIRDAIISAGLKDGMTISFHHHMRNGDYVLNMVMEEIAAMGIKDLTLNATALFDSGRTLYSTEGSSQCIRAMLYLAMMDITKKWTGRRQDWSKIYAQLTIFFEERLPE